MDLEPKIQTFANLMLFLKGKYGIPNEGDTEDEILEKEKIKEKYLKSVSVTKFSDSFIISRERDIENGLEILLDACFIWLWGTYLWVFLEGALTFGKIVHKNDFVFGPGFIYAYKLEKEQAKYPGIIIDDAGKTVFREW